MTLKAKNEIPLTSEFLLVVLSDLSTRIQKYFGSMCPVNLVVHGGAVMVLHHKLGVRQYTFDIDYCHRAFVTQWKNKGLYDADARLRTCIAATAERFDLGADWMNAHADVALPCSVDPKTGQTYDYVWHDAMDTPNVRINTIYSSPALNLIAVPWSWGVALKLARYQKYDPYDISCILTLGKSLSVKRWSAKILESWLLNLCGAMGYTRYPPHQMALIRSRMQHAITLAEGIQDQGKQNWMHYYQNQLVAADPVRAIPVC